jgi:hypothetical protein
MKSSDPTCGRLRRRLMREINGDSVYAMPCGLMQPVAWFAGLAGVQPVCGGSDQGKGTTNFLVGLGTGASASEHHCVPPKGPYTRLRSHLPRRKIYATRLGGSQLDIEQPASGFGTPSVIVL